MNHASRRVTEADLDRSPFFKILKRLEMEKVDDTDEILKEPVIVPSTTSESEGLDSSIEVIAPFVCNPLNTASPITESPKGLDKMPSRFDWREKASLANVLDQHACGACWAIAVAGMMSDRYAIAEHQKNPNFDPIEIIACAKNKEGGKNNGCRGDSPATAFRYVLETKGLPVTHTCNYDQIAQKWKPRRGSNIDMAVLDGAIPSCETCTPHSSAQRVQLTSAPFTPMTGASVAVVQSSVMEGPVVSVMRIFEDFKLESIKGKQGQPLFADTGGVYINQRDLRVEHYGSGAQEGRGYHAVVIVGWETRVLPIYIHSGLIKRVPLICWIVRNSWGENYGRDGGYFRMAATNTRFAVNTGVGADVGLQSKSGLEKLCGIWAAHIARTRTYGDIIQKRVSTSHVQIIGCLLVLFVVCILASGIC